MSDFGKWGEKEQDASYERILSAAWAASSPPVWWATFQASAAPHDGTGVFTHDQRVYQGYLIVHILELALGRALVTPAHRPASAASGVDFRPKMADPTLMMAPIGPGIAFIVPVADSSAESSPQASPAGLSPAALETAATPTTLHAPDAISPADVALEDVIPADDQEAASVPARAPLCLRHAPPRKQRAGTFVQPWQFRWAFE